MIAAWVIDFNTNRPHAALGYQTPAGFALHLTTAIARTPAKNLPGASGWITPRSIRNLDMPIAESGAWLGGKVSSMAAPALAIWVLCRKTSGQSAQTASKVLKRRQNEDVRLTRVLCPICDSDTSFVKSVYACAICGHRYRPYDVDPIAFHDEEYRTTHQRAQGELTEGHVTDLFHEQRAKIVAQRLVRIKKFLRKSDTVLDAGGGAGTFAMALRGMVSSVTVNEVNEDLLRECERNGLPTIKGPIQDLPIDTKYDVVFSWHSLEHCEPLLPAARTLKSLFRRHLILEIPKERGAPEQFDGHFHFFSDQSLQLLFDDLVIRHYNDGVQHPSRLVVFEKKRQVVLAESRAEARRDEDEGH